MGKKGENGVKGEKTILMKGEARAGVRKGLVSQKKLPGPY